MSVSELLSWGALATAIVTAFVLGMAPIFTVRLIACIYPKGHDRRRELVAELAYIKGLDKTLEQWRWLGEMFATAVCDGLPVRLRAIRRKRHALRGGGKVGTSQIRIEFTGESSRSHQLIERRRVVREGGEEITYWEVSDGGVVEGPVFLPDDFAWPEGAESVHPIRVARGDRLTLRTVKPMS